MPMHFDRFRLLNNGRKLRNESEHPVFVQAEDASPQIPVAPGEEVHLPYSYEGGCIIEIQQDDE